MLDDALYQQVLFRIAAHPNDLTRHVQRIVLSYKNAWSHRYYAALSDLLWVLNGKGKALAWRLFNGGRALLNDTQKQQIESYLQSNDNQAVKASPDTLLINDLIGVSCWMTQSIASATISDPLTIAQGFIEYSQIDEAILTLEQAIRDDPECQELQTELLVLYKATRARERCFNFYQQQLSQGTSLSSEWQDCLQFLQGSSHEA